MKSGQRQQRGLAQVQELMCALGRARPLVRGDGGDGLLGWIRGLQTGRPRTRQKKTVRATYRSYVFYLTPPICLRKARPYGRSLEVCMAQFLSSNLPANLVAKSSSGRGDSGLGRSERKG